MKEHILITGVSGSGKSTLAKEMAKKTDMPIVELDQYDKSWREGDYTEGVRKGVFKALKELEEPSIIEGQGIMRMKPEEIKDHKLVIVKPDDETIVSRRWERSVKKHGPDIDKTKYDEKARWMIDADRDNIENLRKNHPKVKIIED